MMDVEIKCLDNEGELKKLKELQSKNNAPEIYKHYPDHDKWLDTLYHDIKTNKCVFCAYIGDKLVGNIIIENVKNTETSLLKIKNIYVDKNWRKKGIGTRLLKYAEDYAIKKGYKRIEVKVPCNEKECIDFFKKNGYTLKSTYKSRKTGEDIAILYKEL
jgi:GNAT superfamily N-acetyltransferase